MRAHINYTTPLAFSVAAGASKVLGLDKERITNALAIAGVGAVFCAVIQAEPVSNWKGLASGEAASRALHNTYLARTGITGTLGVFDGPHGIFQIVRERLDTDWTTEWFAYARRSSIKKYNAEFQSQSATEATDEMFIIAARAVVEQVTDESLATGLIYPPQSQILNASLHVATRVAEYIFDKNLAGVSGPNDIGALIAPAPIVRST